MIVFFAIRHFYIKYLPRSSDHPIILACSGKVWDFSPELKAKGISCHTSLKAAQQLFPGIEIVEIELRDFSEYNQELLQWCTTWTSQIEVEYPHAWYCQLPDYLSQEDFAKKFTKLADSTQLEIVYGGGSSKFIAKLAAQMGENTCLTPNQEQDFLHRVPIDRLNLPESKKLHRLGIHTLGDVSRIPKSDLTQQFGKRARELSLLAKGEDLQPLTPRNPVNISWEMDFTTNPDTEDYMAQPLLNIYVKQAAQSLSEELQQSQQQAGKLMISWEADGKRTGIEKRLAQHTNNQGTIMRLLQNNLPCENINKINIECAELTVTTGDQLQFFSNPTPSKTIDALLQRLGEEMLTTITLARREKVLAMWEEHHL